MRFPFHQSVVLLAALPIAHMQGRSARAEYQFETIALSGDIAPGSGGSGADVPFTSFVRPVLNAAGEVAFLADTSDNADGDDGGVFTTVGGTLHVVAFDGQIAPGSGGSGADVPFSEIVPISFPFLTLNSAGEVTFGASTSVNADGGEHGIFSTVGGSLDTVAFAGQIAPGSGGSGADVPFSRLFLSPPSYPDFSSRAAGEVTFIAETTDNADGDNVGIFSTVGGTLHAVAFDGQTAPGSGGSGADVPFQDFSSHVINGLGESAFLGLTSVNAEGDSIGIFSTVGGSLHTVAFQGQIAPGSGGSGADVPFSSFPTHPFPPQFLAFNAAGDLAFQASTSINADGGGSGIFSTVGGTLDAVAFEGQIAPGSGGSGVDVPFSSFPVSFSDIALNSASEVAFIAQTIANTDGGDTGIFGTVGGSLHAVVFEGDQIEVAPGDTRNTFRCS